jgi:hypothetical protein
MKLCFVSENGARETYFVDAPRTRINNDFHVKFCTAPLFKKSMSNMGIELYGKVPNIIKTVDFSVFKKDLKSVLLKHYFYTITEFVSLNKYKRADAHVLMSGRHNHV